MMNRIKLRTIIGLPSILVCGVFLACCFATVEQAKAAAKLELTPAKTFLSPALIKAPIVFSGSGFAPGEIVIVEMMLPKGMKMKGLSEGEEKVGIGSGNADDNGNFKAAMEPSATLNWFFQVGWTPEMKPDFKAAKPIPPGEYEIIATGMDSERVGKAVLVIVPPPKKE